MPFCLSTFSSPLGELTVVGSDDALVFLDFSDSKELQSKIERIETHFQTKIYPGSNPIIEKT
jgi:O6-methylguanine-DNA--protein-cysteine methyltransferase